MTDIPTEDDDDDDDDEDEDDDEDDDDEGDTMWTRDHRRPPGWRPALH